MNNGLKIKLHNLKDKLKSIKAHYEAVDLQETLDRVSRNAFLRSSVKKISDPRSRTQKFLRSEIRR